MISITPNLSGLTSKPPLILFLSLLVLIVLGWVSPSDTTSIQTLGAIVSSPTRHQKSRLIFLFPFLSNINLCLDVCLFDLHLQDKSLAFHLGAGLVQMCVHACSVASVVSDSFRPQRPIPTRLLCPWDFPGMSAEVGCHFLLQGIFLTQGSNPGLLHLLHCRQILFC